MAVCPFASQSARYDDSYSGTYTGGPYKGLLHTTETSVLPRYGGGASAPHFTVVPDVKTRTVRIYQHYNTSRPARALLNKAGGVQTNNDSAIQIELVGTCDPKYRGGGKGLYWPDAPKWALDGLKKLMRWVEYTHGVPRVATKRPWLAYPSSYGSLRGQRMTQSEWDNFAGWCGHMHVAENDHGDPGNIDIAYLLSVGAPTTTVIKVGSTVAALAAALGLSVTALLGANPALPVQPSATVTAGTTVTIPPANPITPTPVTPKPVAPKPSPAAPKPVVVPTSYKVVTAPASSRPLLRRGMAGEAVKTVQRAIGAPADGFFGPGTESKLRGFQLAKGLTSDGVVGPATWGKILPTKAASRSTTKTTVAPRPVLRKGSESRHVRTVQAKVGVGVDGIFGSQTDRAVRAFQRKKGLAADGVVGPRTWAAIL